MKRFNQLDKRNGSCRFTMRSRISSTSLIPNPQLPLTVAPRGRPPLLVGARLPRPARSSDYAFPLNHSSLAGPRLT